MFFHVNVKAFFSTLAGEKTAKEVRFRIRCGYPHPGLAWPIPLLTCMPSYACILLLGMAIGPENVLEVTAVPVNWSVRSYTMLLNCQGQTLEGVVRVSSVVSATQSVNTLAGQSIKLTKMLFAAGGPP